ncbi:MAG: WD40 repeat domain-containing protein [Acidobacteria bacterium]|nr:WD40 repeat domain-containing protein [Acidobacteriota bacterium]
MSRAFGQRFGLVLLLLACPLAAQFPAAAQGAPEWLWPAGGHAGIPYARLTPDGATLVSGATSDTTLKVWRAGDGILQRTLVHGVGQVHAVAVSPDGVYVATAGEFVQGSGVSPVVLWRIADGALIRTFTGDPDNQADSIAFSPDGTEIAAGEGFDVYVWRVADGALLHTLTGHQWSVFSVAFSPDGQLIATGSGDNTAKIWRRDTGALQRTLTGHTFFVSGVAWSPDSARLATSSWDGTSRVWNVSTGNVLKTFTDTDALYAVDWSANGALVATGGVTRAVHLFNPDTGALVRDATDPEMTDIFSVAFAADGASVVAGSSEGHSRLFRVSDGTLIRRYGTHTGRVDSVACSPTGPEVASSGTESTPAEQTIKIWDKDNGALLRQLVGHSDEIGQVTFSRDGTVLASAAGHLGFGVSTDHSIKLWNPATGVLLRTLPGHAKVSWRVAFSPDGAQLASGGEEVSQNTVRIWRVSDGALLTTIPSLPDVPHALGYTPDGSLLLVALSTEIRYYQPPAYTLVKTIPAGNGVDWIAISPDGTTVAGALSAYGANVALWRISDGALLWTATGHPDGFCQSVAWAPDGQTLISGSGYSRDIRVWRASDGALLRFYDREGGWGLEPMLPLAVGAGGKMFVYGRTDATVIAASYPFGPAIQLAVSKNTGAGAVHLEWSGGAAPYTLRRARDPQFSQDVQTLVDHQAITSYDDPVLDDALTYYYDVE